MRWLKLFLFYTFKCKFFISNYARHTFNTVLYSLTVSIFIHKRKATIIFIVLLCEVLQNDILAWSVYLSLYNVYKSKLKQLFFDERSWAGEKLKLFVAFFIIFISRKENNCKKQHLGFLPNEMAVKQWKYYLEEMMLKFFFESKWAMLQGDFDFKLF